MSDPIDSVSSDRETPGLGGHNNAGGDGVYGGSKGGAGVHGEMLTDRGGVAGRGFLGGIEAIKGEPAGVYGESSNRGVLGHSDIGIGVFGHTNSGTAVYGEGPNGSGLIGGIDPAFNEAAGVFGQSDRRGVVGIGLKENAIGVHGSAEDGTGVMGDTTTGVAIAGTSAGSGLAGKFTGDIEITGRLTASNADGLHLMAGALRIHGTDVLLDGRSAQAAPGQNFRALVDLGNKLVLNFQGDFGDGVEVQSALSVDGNASVAGNFSVGADTSLAGLSVGGDIALAGGLTVSNPDGLDLNAPVLRIHGSDVLLDGRSAVAFPDRLFRALVDMTDKLVINFNGDFNQGVEIDSDLVVTGRVRSHGGDCAEQFDIAAEADDEPGNVMVICADGTLDRCRTPYDTKVAGVVSGGGDLEAALLLNERAGHRAPIALVGSVYCKVDAGYGPIAAGDPLTSSATPGHAMKAADWEKSHGAIIGKALQPLAQGTGMIPMLVLPH